jgi:hypothetical protein
MSKNLRSRIHTYYIALGVFLLTLVILLATQSRYGLAWDEPYNYNPSVLAWDWTKLVLTNPASAFSDNQITTHWSEIHEHPSLSKWIACFSYGLFHRTLGDLLSFRLGEFIFFAIFLAVFYQALSILFSKTVGLFSALILFFMPRIFAQAHFATTDIPMMIMAFYTVLCFYKGLDSTKWSVILGIIWGLALATKINALFLPIPLIIWAHIFYRQKWGRNIFCMIFISPIISLLSWPWLWHHTLERIFDYLSFYTGHKDTTVFYLGKMYTLTPAPWHYPWVYTFATIPIASLVFILYGIVQLLRKSSINSFIKPNDTPLKKNFYSVGLLFLFMSLFPILLQSLPNTPRYDGIRLFLPAFPFLAALAGLGFISFLRNFIKERSSHTVILLIFLLPSLFQTWDTHPYELSYYNYLLGGITGAHNRGMESSYWCEAVNKQVWDYLNQNLPPNSKIQFDSFSDEVLQWYKDHGWIRKDLNVFPKENPDFYVLLCRQGFFGQQEWFLYNQVKPIQSFQLQGVPLVNIYPASPAIP